MDQAVCDEPHVRHQVHIIVADMEFIWPALGVEVIEYKLNGKKSAEWRMVDGRRKTLYIVFLRAPTITISTSHGVILCPHMVRWSGMVRANH